MRVLWLLVCQLGLGSEGAVRHQGCKKRFFVVKRVAKLGCLSAVLGYEARLLQINGLDSLGGVHNETHVPAQKTV